MASAESVAQEVANLQAMGFARAMVDVNRCNLFIEEAQLQKTEAWYVALFCATASTEAAVARLQGLELEQLRAEAIEMLCGWKTRASFLSPNGKAPAGPAFETIPAANAAVGGITRYFNGGLRTELTEPGLERFEYAATRPENTTQVLFVQEGPVCFGLRRPVCGQRRWRRFATRRLRSTWWARSSGR